MKKLRCIGRYVNQPRNLAFNAGEEFDIDDETARFLMRDAPGSFKALDSPPANKAVLDAPESKGPVEHDLTVISGISDARQRQLQFAGIYTYADLAEADVGVLMQLHGVGEQTANEWMPESSKYLALTWARTRPPMQTATW